MPGNGPGNRGSSGPTCPPRLATPDDVDAVIGLIIDQQARPDRNTPTLGVTSASVLAELEDLEPPWIQTLRIASSDDGRLVGAVLIDWSAEARRAWIHGPWADADDQQWPEIGAVLLEAATSQLPAEIATTVMTAIVEHHCMANLAGRLGWSAGEVNHVLVVDAKTVETWTSPTDPDSLRSMTDDDVAAIRALHDVEFPSTYYSAAELAARVSRGDQIVLIADLDDGSIGGYVAGQIQPDGDGYIDFLAVAAAARQSGIGRELVTTLCRQLIPRTATLRVCLTVQDQRAPARALYDSLGFKRDGSIVGFESPAP